MTSFARQRGNLQFRRFTGGLWKAAGIGGRAGRTERLSRLRALRPLLEMQGDELAGASHVLDHATPSLLRIASLDRLENPLVLFDVLLQQPGALRERGPREVPRKAPVQVGDHVVQPSVPRGVEDRLVEE